MYATDLPKSVLFDFASSLCGDKIGHGISREVYVWALDNTLVLKLETGYKHQNVIEWETWCMLKDTPHAIWLAPCKWISACGTALLMHRTMPMRPGEEPAEVPAWLTDHKRLNYGLLPSGKIVCHDYGTNLLINHGAFSKKKSKPEWWD